MGLLIDASVLIEHERGRLDLGAAVESREGEEFFLSVVTASELLHGVRRAEGPAGRARRSAFVEAVLSSFPLLPVDLLTARTHARIGAELEKRGERIGAHDLWIAAACVAHGLTVASGNEREFRRVPGLEVEVWSG